MNMKKKHKSPQDSPVKALLSAAYGPGTISAQLLAVFLTQYFAVTALDRKLRAQAKLSKRVGQEQRGYAHALSAYVLALVEETRKAAQTGNAQFLKDLASAFEEARRTSRGRDPVRTWLMMHKLKGEPPKTMRQMQEWLRKDAQSTVAERQVYRLCAELGVPLAKAQEGRPPKTPTTAEKQGRSFSELTGYNRSYL
jgi:hypothetical protein